MKPKLILCLALLLGGLALCGVGLWLLLSPSQYAATVRIKLENDEPDSSGNVSYGPYFPQVEFEIIKSQLVLSNVVAGLNLPMVWGKKYSHGEPLKYAECYAIIKNHLRFTLVQNTKMVDITYYSDDPKQAADVANAIGAGYKEYRNQSRKKLIAKVLEVLQQQYQDEEKQISLQPTNGEQMIRMHKLLAEKIEAMKIEPIPATVPVQIIDPAEPPQFPVSSNRPLGAALLAVGLFPLLRGILLLKSKP
jgi:capsular polysaccharide biosynthesis protein